LLKDVHRGGTSNVPEPVNLRDYTGYITKTVPASYTPGWGHFKTFHYLIFPAVNQRWRTADVEAFDDEIEVIEIAPPEVQMFFARVRYPRYYRIIQLFAVSEEHVKYLLTNWYPEVVIHKIGPTRESTYAF